MDPAVPSAKRRPSQPPESPAVPRGRGARPARRRLWWSRVRLVVLVSVALGVLFARPAVHHARAASLLLSFSGPPPAASAAPVLLEERISFDVGGRAVPARTYAPIGSKNAPGIVMVHGVHHRGIEEPRLQRFARAVASAGYVVMTPEVSELSDYKVARSSVDTVGAATAHLRAQLGVAKVGLMGMSFGGGVCLLTAADARFAKDVGFVVAIGAHDDLARVSRFFVTNEAVEPSGEKRAQHAHEYGATVLVYSRIEAFFPPEDVPAARAALGAWLHEERDVARKEAAALSPPSRAKVEKLFAADIASLREELLAVVDKEKDEMRKVSPHGNLLGLEANVYLLHGEKDSVIPATETLWLARDVPQDRLRMALVSPAIQHVELEEPALADRWALVHFMGEVLADAERTR